MTATAAGPPDVTSPVPREVWRHALSADPLALVTQTPGWLDAILDTGDYLDAGRWYRWPDGRQLILPMVRPRCAPPGGEGGLAWPREWGIGGVVAPGQPVTEAQARAVFADLGRRRGGPVLLRPSPLTDAVWRSAAPAAARVTPRVTYVVDLAGGFDAVWRERFSGRVRRHVRKAERSDLTVVRGNTPALLDDFDRLYRLSVRRWADQEGTDHATALRHADRTNPRRNFAAVARHLAEDCVIRMAYLGGEPVAGIVTLWHGRHAKYWRGAMDKPAAAATCAPTLLQSLAIREACERGCLLYHMGDSRAGDPVSRFKLGFGAAAHHGAAYALGPL
ncbi:GNAT family N-acetyltransferase [Kitasatospora sp. NBC_00374]|uniref:GNAT family N-acetyltransferase n=1 Tax=Kitasatospora sp. NBC_00374 TaxID=2975964 RepID=UPI003250CB41